MDCLKIRKWMKRRKSKPKLDNTITDDESIRSHRSFQVHGRAAAVSRTIPVEPYNADAHFDHNLLEQLQQGEVSPLQVTYSACEFLADEQAKVASFKRLEQKGLWRDPIPVVVENGSRSTDPYIHAHQAGIDAIPRSAQSTSLQTGDNNTDLLVSDVARSSRPPARPPSPRFQRSSTVTGPTASATSLTQRRNTIAEQAEKDHHSSTEWIPISKKKRRNKKAAMFFATFANTSTKSKRERSPSIDSDDEQEELMMDELMMMDDDSIYAEMYPEAGYYGNHSESSGDEDSDDNWMANQDSDADAASSSDSESDSVNYDESDEDE